MLFKFSIISSIVSGLPFYFVSSNQKTAERFAAAARKQAEAGSRAKSGCMVNISHKMRYQLNHVTRFSELMIKTRLNETQQQCIDMINQSGTLLLDFINRILDCSKIEAGKPEPAVEKTVCPACALRGR